MSEEESGMDLDAAENVAAALADDASEEVEAAPGGDDGGSGSGSSPEPNEIRGRNLDLILDVPLRVTVELGRSKMIVREMLSLGQGSVVELSKLAGETMEVLVNDRLVARGEAVVVNEKFGVRLTDIISQEERAQGLG